MPSPAPNSPTKLSQSDALAGIVLASAVGSRRVLKMGSGNGERESLAGGDTVAAACQQCWRDALGDRGRGNAHRLVAWGSATRATPSLVARHGRQYCRAVYPPRHVNPSGGTIAHLDHASRRSFVVCGHRAADGGGDSDRI